MALLGCLLLGAPRPAEANIVRGVMRVVSGVLTPPLSLIAGTFSGPPVVGTLFGAVNGTFQGAGLITSGVFDLALGGAQLARMAAPFVLPFLF